ncbi:MAG: hypothetical protein RSH24_11440 [Flavobacterium sp.]
MMCFLLFALSSCAVKESLLGLVQTDYAKPTNRSQTTAQNGFCSYTAATGKETSVIDHSKIKNRKESNLFTENNLIRISSKKTTQLYSKTFSGNSPPKYILYKRLKLPIV